MGVIRIPLLFELLEKHPVRVMALDPELIDQVHTGPECVSYAFYSCLCVLLRGIWGNRVSAAPQPLRCNLALYHSQVMFDSIRGKAEVVRAPLAKCIIESCQVQQARQAEEAE